MSSFFLSNNPTKTYFWFFITRIHLSKGLKIHIVLGSILSIQFLLKEISKCYNICTIIITIDHALQVLLDNITFHTSLHTILLQQPPQLLTRKNGVWCSHCWRWSRRSINSYSTQTKGKLNRKTYLCVRTRKRNRNRRSYTQWQLLLTKRFRWTFP